MATTRGDLRYDIQLFQGKQDRVENDGANPLDAPSFVAHSLVGRRMDPFSFFPRDIKVGVENMGVCNADCS